jgi:hypothetical protein
MHALDLAMQAQVLSGLGVYSRAALAQAAGDEPGVVSLRLTCTFESPGVSVIEVELCDRQGNALGGYSL